MSDEQMVSDEGFALYGDIMDLFYEKGANLGISIEALTFALAHTAIEIEKEKLKGYEALIIANKKMVEIYFNMEAHESGSCPCCGESNEQQGEAQ